MGNSKNAIYMLKMMMLLVPSMIIERMATIKFSVPVTMSLILILFTSSIIFPNQMAKAQAVDENIPNNISSSVVTEQGNGTTSDSATENENVTVTTTTAPSASV